MASGNVRQLSKNKFLITLDFGYHPDTKERKRTSVTFNGTEREANLELSRLLDDEEGWAGIDPRKTSLSKFIKIYMESADKRLALSTCRRYRQVFDLRVDPELGHHYLAKISAKHVQDFFDKLPKSKRLDKCDKYLSRESIISHFRILHGLFAAAMKKKLIRLNPCDYIDLPRSLLEFSDEDDADVATFTAAEVKQLLLSLTDVRRMLVSTAVKTGLRRGELLGLQWKDIDLDACTLSVKRSLYYSKADGYIYKPPKTKKSRRTIDISKELAKELKHWQNEQNKMKLRLGDNYIKQDLIFDLGDGNYLNPDTVSSWFPDHAEKIGLPRHNFHILRHTHASILLSLGEDIKKVSERLGHSSVRITYDIYAHLMPGHGKDLAARLEAALS